MEDYIVGEILKFSNREGFRNWLSDHCVSSEGVWLLFGKAGGPKTIKAVRHLRKLSVLDGLTDK